MFIAALFTITKTENSPMCALANAWTKKMWSAYCIYTMRIIIQLKKGKKSFHLQQSGLIWRTLCYATKTHAYLDHCLYS
jgi:hypothetical protein